MVYDLAGRFTRRVESEARNDLNAQLQHVFAIAFGRAPDREELTTSRNMVTNLKQRWLDELKEQTDADREASRRALTNYCHAVMNSAAFVYVD